MTTLYGREAMDVLTSNAPDYEDLDEGTQAKYNHVTCHMGEDTKQRLYVKNVDGAYLWHCHNCGDSGYYRPRETVARIKTMSAAPMMFYKGGVVKLPPLASRNVNDFKPEGQLWLAQYGFDDAAVVAYSIAHIDNGIVLPIFDGSPSIQGYQVRRYEQKPKYVTYTQQTYSYLNHALVGAHNPLIIVEDLLSSYKLHSAGYDTLCLLGTKIDDAGLTIVKNYDRVVVWLDDDEAGHAASMKIYKEISPLVKNVTSINMAQPKEIPIESLKTMEL